MFYNIDLEFNKGSILTKNMLEELYNFNHDYINIKYNNYLDGIILGVDLFDNKNNNENEYYITAGLLKFQGNIFRMITDFNLTRFIKNEFDSKRIEIQNKYKIVFELKTDEYVDKRTSYRRKSMELSILEVEEQYEGIVFANFELSIRGELIVENKIDFDAKKILSYFNSSLFSLLECPYSFNNCSTFHPKVFTNIKEILVKKQRKTAVEYSIINMIIADKVLSTEFMVIFINDNSDGEVELEFKVFYEIDEKIKLLEWFVRSILRDFNVYTLVEDRKVDVKVNEKFNSPFFI